jgi:hypothetical protein
VQTDVRTNVAAIAPLNERQSLMQTPCEETMDVALDAEGE